MELIREEEVRTYQHGSGGNPAPTSIRLTTQRLVNKMEEILSQSTN